MRRLTASDPLATKATGATTYQSRLVFKYHLPSPLIGSMHNCGHRRGFALVKHLVQSVARRLSWVSSDVVRSALTALDSRAHHLWGWGL